MAAKGLNRTDRAIAVEQAKNGCSGEYLQNLMQSMAQENYDKNQEWDYDENVRLAAYLAHEGRVDSARKLERLINGKE